MSDPLKFASRLLIEENGGLEAAASITRIGKTRLQQCISEENNDSYLPIDVVYQLERTSSIPHITNLMASAKIDYQNHYNDCQIFLDFTKLSARFARVMEEYSLSLEDDSEIDKKEARIMIRLIIDLQRTMLSIERKLLDITIDK